MRKMIVLAVSAGLCAGLSGGKDPGATSAGWSQLSLGTCGVDKFLAAHPNADGRGVIIAVLDTGVDPAIPGLTKLPGGEVKMIDMQDFTGDGDVELEWIRLDPASGKLIKPNEEGDPLEYTPPALPADPPGAVRRWWFGELDESRYVNADQPDLNGNDNKEDKFPVLVTALEGDSDDLAICYIDENMDRSFADEKPLRNYKLKYDTFTFHREKPESEIEPMTFGVNIFLRQAKVNFHCDNGAHGTHVAGLAAGYRINNQDGFNGVAPGAQLMSLKIGHGGLGSPSVTESIVKALKYAARYAQEHGVTIVCNLSFGVESEIEGHSDIDKEVNEILRANPYLVFCTSAGNSGPGLSTVGTPAAASQAITIGALLAADSARDVMGYTLKDTVVTTFSSRGGELDKPDIVTPGWSTSTVPRWNLRGDYWSGTSMASPYAAGLCADLISYVRQKDGNAKIRAVDLRRALCLSARPLPGATALDCGYGVPDLAKAAEQLEAILKSAKDDPVQGYEISTPCPYGYKGKARTAYWRSPWFPSTDRQTFLIDPVFMPTTDAGTRTSFTRKFELRSSAPWCRVPQDTIYLRSEQSARAFVEYDGSQLTEPGLYVGTVEAVADGLVAFRLINTVVVPYHFGPEDNFARAFKGQTVEGWNPSRYFVLVPPGASVMRLVLSAPENENSRAGMSLIFDPRGKQSAGDKRLNPDNGVREVEWIVADDLVPGVWEIPITADRPDKQWPYDFKVQFFGLHAAPARITAGPAAQPKGNLLVTNLFERPVPATAEGEMEGFRLHKEDKFKGLEDELTYTINVDERVNRLRLKLEMTPENYATTTDIAVLVKPAEGEAVHKSSFEWRTFETTLNTEGKKTLEVVIHAGFAVADDKREVPITVDIDQVFAKPMPIKVTEDGEANFNLIPGIPVKLQYAVGDKIKDIPAGQRPVGILRFHERSTNEIVLRVPIDVGG